MIETLTFKKLKWLHIQNPADEDLVTLQKDYNFHPLDIEDCRSYTQRPKIDIYDDYYFLILHFPHFDNVKRFVKAKEVKIFWGKDYIITIGQAHWVVEDLFNYYKRNPNAFSDLISCSSDAVLYTILNRLINESYFLINQVGQEIDEMNRNLFSKNAEKTIEKISVIRKNVIQLNTIFKPQLRVFHKFESGEIKGYESKEDMEDYWGNILDLYQKMWDMIEDFEELTDSLSSIFGFVQANRNNEVMRTLTIISTIVLPLTFISGLYGMNVGLPFEKTSFAFWLIIGICFSIVILLIFYFKRKKWM
ncbi:MAG: Magnesium transport protein CorA [Bacteroidetes bacterium ADurb.Bin234]|nr:MAG: Magnesium transport protein CorA [Bacteroidetes bacterium ADurb.Bin234]